MPQIRYYNQTAPFWDFVASLEDQGSSHPLFSGQDRRRENFNESEGPQRDHAWPQGFGWGAWGPIPVRGGPGHHHGPSPPHHEGPPGAPPHHEGSPGPPPPPPGADGDDDREQGVNESEGPQDASGTRRQRHHHGHHGRRGPCGPGARGHWGRGRGGFGGRGRRGFFPDGMSPWGLADAFQNHLFGEGDAGEDSEDFKPEVDVFDTAESFVVHISLAGAKKEDVGVNWNAEKSELSITGVIHRPGDEDFLKTLAMDERKVGAFERNIRLGSRANPAQVDVDAMSAKMEDGVLRIEVPKLDAGYVEVKKVDIE